MCVECNAYHDRDLNVARNIELEGLRLLAGSGYLGVTPVELATSV
jgi:transposase